MLSVSDFGRKFHFHACLIFPPIYASFSCHIRGFMHSWHTAMPKFILMCVGHSCCCHNFDTLLPYEIFVVIDPILLP